MKWFPIGLGFTTVVLLFHYVRMLRRCRTSMLELRRFQSNMESFIGHHADAIWSIDISDRITYVNQAFENMFGWKASEVIGRVLPTIPDSEIEKIEPLHARVKNGESILGYATIRKCKDGRLIHVSTTLSPLLDQDGVVVGLTGSCRDIHERVLGETSLQETKEQLESFIHHHLDAIVMFDKDGKVVRVNQAFEKMFQWQIYEVVGTSLNDLAHIPKEKEEELFELQIRIKDGEVVHGLETQRYRKDGQLLHISLSTFPILDANQKPNGWSVILRDITEWKKTQEFIQHSDKLHAAGQLAAGIAHEIRNPITAISGFVQLMKEGIGDQRQYLNIMSSEIRRIEMIVSELLVLSKPQLLQIRSINLMELFDQVVTLVSTQAILNNVVIRTESPSTDISIQCDQNQIKQVFINFMKNAIEAMPHGGTLTIRVTIVSNHIKIDIIDTGCGIPEHVLPKLGQPFFTTKENGTGLGFMVSKKIIENHLGTIAVSSRVSQGTTIAVTLPL